MSGEVEKPTEDGGLSGTMESNLEEKSNEIMKDEAVRGMMCCNKKGDLFCSRGTLNEDSAAIISHLSTLVGQIENEDPVIQLEGKDSRLVIHKRGDVIVGIHKNVHLANQQEAQRKQQQAAQEEANASS